MVDDELLEISKFYNDEIKKIKKRSSRTVLIVILATAIVASTATSFVKDKILIYFPGRTLSQTFTNKLTVIDNVLKKNYLYDIDDEKMTEQAIASYVEGLDEPYTHYYTKQEFSDYTSNLSDSYVGIGIVIVKNDKNEIEVLSAFEDSPANKAGILPGDVITAVDGTAYSGDKMTDAVNHIKSGKRGTNVTLTVMRDDDEPFDVSVERGDISSNSVKTEMLDNSIGYMRITAFNTDGDGVKQNTYTEFCDELAKLQESGMQKMIIDLRDNPGGALDVVCNIADVIVPKGTITYMEYKDGRRETFSSDDKELNIPIVVLINENSASASEVLTGCLKDYKKATVVGKKSYGKGIVQTVYPFTDGSGMSVTVARYFSPNGVCIHGTGIEPDIEVDAPEKYKDYYSSAIPHDEDTQLQKAIEVLGT